MYTGSELESPNENVSSSGPTSNSTSPWNFGPVTWISPPVETEIVISPIQTSIVAPAEMCA